MSPDVLSVSQQLHAALATTALNDGLFSLGTYDTPTRGSEALAHSVSWDPTKHNQGMGFNRTFWERLKGCSQMFCDYDDYNWDWTLLRLSANKCFDKKTAYWSRAQPNAVSGLRTLLLKYVLGKGKPKMNALWWYCASKCARVHQPLVCCASPRFTTLRRDFVCLRV